MNQSFSKIFNFVDGVLETKSGAIINLGRWSDIVAIRLPDILFGLIKFE